MPINWYHIKITIKQEKLMAVTKEITSIDERDTLVGGFI